MQGLNSRGAPPTGLRCSVGRGLRRLPLAAACTLVGTGAGAQNDPNPYYIGITQGITHNTNINNFQDGPADTNSSTGLVGGFDQQIGRQRVYGSGNVTLNRYRRFSELDNTSYGLNAGLDWQTINEITGTVYTNISQGLANLQNNLLQQTADRNIVRTQQLGTRANWGGNGKLTIGGGYGYSKTYYTTATLLAGDSSNQTADIGIYFHPGATLSLGTAYRATRSNSERAFLLPDGTYLDNRTSGRNIDLSAVWTPNALSSLNARLSFTNQSNANGGEGFSGLTGALGFNYAATGKLSFNGQFNRDASTNGAFYNTFNGTTNTNTDPTIPLAASNSVSNNFSVGANYAATGKVSVVANASYRQTSQDDNSGTGVVGGGYRDSYRNYSLGANWAIRRFWSLNCLISRADRRLEGFVGANANYSGTIYSCTTQVTLR